MSDILHTFSIIIEEYADDIAIIITEDTLEEAVTRTQIAIQELEMWARMWCLVFNSDKTKSLCFTKKRIKEKLEEPEFQLKVNNSEIEWVKSIKYLGVTLDAPTLTWNKHYDELLREGLQRINIMRAISGTSWGAGRELLLSFYKAYIRSKLSYGAAATASACQTRQEILERIQNAAMRVALGARRTSPIIAMQTEANLISFKEYLKSHSLQYYYRKKAQEHQIPFIDHLEDDPTTEDKIWTPGIFKKPLVRRIPDIKRELRMPVDLRTKTTRIPTIPPWQPLSIILKPELLRPITREVSIETKKMVALETINMLYTEHLQLYRVFTNSGNPCFCNFIKKL